MLNKVSKQLQSQYKRIYFKSIERTLFLGRKTRQRTFLEVLFIDVQMLFEKTKVNIFFFWMLDDASVSVAWQHCRRKNIKVIWVFPTPFTLICSTMFYNSPLESRWCERHLWLIEKTYSTFCIDFGITRWFISFYLEGTKTRNIDYEARVARRALTNDKFSSGRKSPKSLEE